MPDISMCENDQCPLHDKCYRYLAIPNDFQCYGYFAPDEYGDCKDFEEAKDADG